MTTLPATLLEAEAVDFARQCIAYARSGKLQLFGVEPGRKRRKSARLPVDAP
jgi:hypothetical protein